MSHARCVPVLLAASLLVALPACREREREPVTRAQATSIADGLLLHHGREWGLARTVTAPADEPGEDGKRWWIVDYGPDAEGVPRIILVNHESRWAKFAPPGP